MGTVQNRDESASSSSPPSNGSNNQTEDQDEDVGETNDKESSPSSSSLNSSQHHVGEEDSRSSATAAAAGTTATVEASETKDSTKQTPPTENGGQEKEGSAPTTIKDTTKQAAPVNNDNSHQNVEDDDDTRQSNDPRVQNDSVVENPQNQKNNGMVHKKEGAIIHMAPLPTNNNNNGVGYPSQLQQQQYNNFPTTIIAPRPPPLPPIPPFPSILDLYRIPFKGGKFLWQYFAIVPIQEDHLLPLVLTVSYGRDLRNLKHTMEFQLQSPQQQQPNTTNKNTKNVTTGEHPTANNGGKEKEAYNNKKTCHDKEPINTSQPDEEKDANSGEANKKTVDENLNINTSKSDQEENVNNGEAQNKPADQNDNTSKPDEPEKEDVSKDNDNRGGDDRKTITVFRCPRCDDFRLVFQLTPGKPINTWCLQVEQSNWVHNLGSCPPTNDVMNIEVFENLPCVLTLMRTNQIMGTTKDGIEDICKSNCIYLKLSKATINRSIKKLKGKVIAARRFLHQPPPQSAHPRIFPRSSAGAAAAAGYPMISPLQAAQMPPLQQAQMRLVHSHQQSAHTASLVAFPGGTPSYGLLPPPQHHLITSNNGTSAKGQKRKYPTPSFPPLPPHIAQNILHPDRTKNNNNNTENTAPSNFGGAAKLATKTDALSEFADIQKKFWLPEGHFWTLGQWRELITKMYEVVTSHDAVVKGYYSVRGFSKKVLGQPNKSQIIQRHWNRSGLRDLAYEKVPSDSQRVKEAIEKAFPDDDGGKRPVVQANPYAPRKHPPTGPVIHPDPDSYAYNQLVRNRPDASEFKHIQKQFGFPDDLPKHLRQWKPEQWRELMFIMYVFLTSPENASLSVKFFCSTVLKQPNKEQQIQKRWKDSGLKELAVQGELSTSDQVSSAIQTAFPDIDPETAENKTKKKKPIYDIVEELKILEKRHKEPLKWDSMQWRRLLAHMYNWFMTTPEASIRRFANKVLEMPEKRYVVNDYWRESGLAALFEEKEPADSDRVKEAIEFSFPIQGSAKKQEEINNLFFKTFANFTDKNGRRPTLEYLEIIQKAIERKGERQRGETLFNGTLKAAKKRRLENQQRVQTNDDD